MYNMVRLKIFQGQDKKITFKLRRKNGDPLDLTGATGVQVAFTKADRSQLVTSMNQVAAKKASYTVSENMIFIAVSGGANGNNIVLSFDGIQTVQEIVDAWNLANAGNTVEFEGEAASVLPTQNIQLTGGYDAYIPVSITDEKLGHIQCILIDYDTSSLRLGKNQDIKITIDYGNPPNGTRLITVLDGKLDIYA
jgi:hypothetical protein